MNHFPPVFLKEGKNSTAYYSRKNSEKLVVFVHGFHGTAVGTWNDFPSLIQSTQEFASADVLFYGYNSLKGQAFDQGQDFYKFLDKYVNQTSIQLRVERFDYKDVRIVAHSLGAVVSRYALLHAIEKNDSWRNLCRLFLFAPAHNGARIQNLVTLSLPSFFKVAGGLGLFLYPILDDLKPKSLCLDNLEKLTEKHKNSTNREILKAIVLHAKGDKVVHNNQFCYDNILPTSPINGKSHTSICKPKKPIYLTPVDELIKFI